MSNRLTTDGEQVILSQSSSNLREEDGQILLATKYVERLHPRDENGKWVRKGALRAVAQLRQDEVVYPERQVVGDLSGGWTEHRTKERMKALGWTEQDVLDLFAFHHPMLDETGGHFEIKITADADKPYEFQIDVDHTVYDFPIRRSISVDTDTGESAIWMEWMEVPWFLQGTGVAKAHMSSMLKVADRKNVTHFRLNAGMDVGKYAWARYGFDYAHAAWVKSVPNQTTHQVRLLEELRKQYGRMEESGWPKEAQDAADWLRQKRHSWEIASFKLGEISGKRAMLEGTEWYAVLTVDKNSESRQIMDAYLAMPNHPAYDRKTGKKLPVHFSSAVAEYVESKHPRGPDGKWINKGASVSSKITEEVVSGGVPRQSDNKVEVKFRGTVVKRNLSNLGWNEDDIATMFDFPPGSPLYDETIHVEVRKDEWDNDIVHIKASVGDRGNKQFFSEQTHWDWLIHRDPEDPALSYLQFDYMKVADEHQGQGIARDHLAAVVRVADERGATGISMLANLSVGGYAWARYGFDFAVPFAGERYIKALRENMTGEMQKAKARGYDKEPWFIDGWKKAVAWLDDPRPKHSWGIASFQFGGIKGRDFMLETQWHAYLPLESKYEARRVLDGYLKYGNVPGETGVHFAEVAVKGYYRKGHWVRSYRRIVQTPSEYQAAEDRTDEEFKYVMKALKGQGLDHWPAADEVVTEILDGHTTTRAMHKKVDGYGDYTYTPERIAQHDKWIEECFEGKTPMPDGEDRIAVFLAGGAASGKSGVTQLPEVRENFFPDIEHSIVINPDTFKFKMPEFNALIDAGSANYAATAVHDESSGLAKRLYREATDRGYSVIMDGVGNNGPGMFASKMGRAHNDGYTVRVVVVTLPTKEAVIRAYHRAEEEHRMLPYPLIVEQHQSVSRYFDQYAMLPFIERGAVYDNYVSLPDPPGLIAEFSRGQIEVTDNFRFNRFKEKANGY